MKMGFGRKKKRAFLILYFFLMIFLWNPLAYTQEPLSLEELFELIEEELSNHRRASAYEYMKTFYENANKEEALEKILKNLAYMVKVEKTYKKYDQMIKHAIELYELSEDSKTSYYKVIALDALAYYDYVTFNNAKSAERLSQILELNPTAYQYKTGLANLEIDQGNYEKAFSLYDEALKLIASENSEINRYFNEAYKVKTNIAYAYFEIGDVENAIDQYRQAQSFLAEEDYDYLIDLKLSLANLFYASQNYEETQRLINELNREHPKSTSLLKNVIPIQAIRELEANLTFQMGAYENAAKLFYELNLNPHSVLKPEENIAANEQIDRFNKLESRKQIDLLEKLAQEQVEKNEIQKKFLWVAFSTIFLLMILVGVFIGLIYYYKKQRGILFTLSITDPLTKIYNRRKIVQSFEAIEKGERCVALIDIDYFKAINDTYGHVVGDEVIFRVAQTISSSIRPQDQVGRYGGEEFLVILDTPDIQEAVQIGERIRLNVENLTWPYENLKTTISIGVIQVTEASDILLTEVDALLYESKENGRNQLRYK